MLIGINKYQTLFGDLSYCRNDISGLKEVLVENGVPKEHITVLTDGAEGSSPSRSNIRYQLRTSPKTSGRKTFS